MSDDRNLPAVPDDDDIVEGEIVEDEPGQDQAAAPRPVAVVRAVVTDKRTQAAGRHMVYVVLGLVVGVRRLRKSRSTSRHDRWLRAAELSGDWDKVLELEARRTVFRRDRHAWRMDWLAAPGRVAQQLPWRILRKLRCCPWRAGHLAKAIHVLQTRETTR